MSLRFKFVSLAQQENANIAELRRRFGISRKSAYKWLESFRQGGATGLEDRVRRPQYSPQRLPEAIRAQVLALRAEHPARGPRKLRRCLEDLGVRSLPVPSAISRWLHQAGCIAATASLARQRYKRLERGRSNELWQMDFKGHFGLSCGGRCHPLAGTMQLK
jgi:transposase-like protein